MSPSALATGAFSFLKYKEVRGRLWYSLSYETEVNVFV